MLVLVGPSASGKSAIVKCLESKYGIKKFITCTTRPMRVGEINGVDYFFMTKEEFAKFMDTITPFEREAPPVKKPCIGCIYFAACGSTTRTMPCKGRITKSRKAKEK